MVLTIVALLLLGTQRLYKAPQAVAAAEEQAVIIKLKLASGAMGNEVEQKRITDLEDHLADAIKRSSTGEFDGDEYGEGFCTIYMYGPSAERLYATVQPKLKDFHAESGSYVIKRCGKPGSKEDRITLAGK